MEAAMKPDKYDFRVWSDVRYEIDCSLPADTFFEDITGIFHIGPGTDLHRRLFELSLTKQDLKFCKALQIDPLR